MKQSLFRILAGGLVLLCLSTTACRGSDDTTGTGTDTTVEASESAAVSKEDTATDTDTTEETTRSTETITEGTYPDGETNPDWPYSPGV